MFFLSGWGGGLTGIIQFNLLILNELAWIRIMQPMSFRIRTLLLK
jgi:hypothetical protein